MGTRLLSLVLFLALLLTGCGNGGQPSTGDDPTAAYRHFFTELSRGNTQRALDGLAPEGALGNTFQGAGYYMLADTVNTSLEEHGGLSEIIIDNTREHDDDSVTVEGRLILRDGTELERRIRFSQENGRWVGRV